MHVGKDELPEEGELVMATVNDVLAQGAYVSLDEYDGLIGFLHISEIATGWVKNIEHYVKPHQKLVLKVIRVNKARREVDLSLRQVTNEERRLKLIEYKKSEKAKAFLRIIKERCNMSDEEFNRYVDIMLDEYPLLYDMFEDVARKGIKCIEHLNLPEVMLNAIQEIASKIRIPGVEIGGVIELMCPREDGIEVIKDTLLNAIESKGSTMKDGKDVKVNILYLGAPRYRLTIKAENFKVAEKTLNSILQSIQKSIEKKGGVFKFTREESRKGVTD